MARSRSGKRKRRASAMSTSIANRRLRRPDFVPVVLPLRPIEDRRTYHPLGMFRPAATLGDLKARTVVAKPRRMSSPARVPAGLGFLDPRRVVICVRRKIRREVLFARGAGGSKRRQQKRRRNWFSSISCRR